MASGLVGTILPAIGYLPGLGFDRPGLWPWRELFDLPGFWTSSGLSLITGLTSTLLALLLATAALSLGERYRFPRVLRRLLSPLLAVPHAAFAIGLAFLLAPSGWLVRLISPWLTGFDRPPDIASVQDPFGIALILGLVLKEAPFLILVGGAALGNVAVGHHLGTAQSLGYRPTLAWFLVILPQLYGALRLPIFAVLAFSTSVVDMALVLGPTAPPPIAIRTLELMNDPELSRRLVGAAAALWQLGLVLIAVMIWLGVENLAGRVGRWRLAGGSRIGHLRWPALASTTIATILSLSALISVAVWSFAGRWRFPDALPSTWRPERWPETIDGLAPGITTTLGVGLVASLVALILATGCLEYERHNQTNGGGEEQRWVPWLLYLPLLVPQISFLFGVQVMTALTGLDGTLLALILVHLLFAFPYVFLSLAGPYRRFDGRYDVTARTLGHSWLSSLLRIKLPILMTALATAAAVGFAVSVSLYLPSVFVGAGRWPTLVVETMALAVSGDRRAAAVAGALITLLPLIGFWTVAALRRWQQSRHPALRRF
ncbi:MAG: ABC transporter permease [Geminicoccaceae bacterium]